MGLINESDQSMSLINQWVVNLELRYGICMFVRRSCCVSWIFFLECFFLSESVMSVNPNWYWREQSAPVCVRQYLLFVHAEEKVFRKRRSVFKLVTWFVLYGLLESFSLEVFFCLLILRICGRIYGFCTLRSLFWNDLASELIIYQFEGVYVGFLSCCIIWLLDY